MNTNKNNDVFANGKDLDTLQKDLDTLYQEACKKEEISKQLLAEIEELKELLKR